MYEVLSLIPRHLRETVALIIMLGIIEKPDINISVVERGIYDPIKLYEWTILLAQDGHAFVNHSDYAKAIISREYLYRVWEKIA